MSVVVHLVRHAQTAWNVEGRFLGAADIPLTSLGQAHARQLVAAFADVPLAAVYASDLCRAMDTAAPIAVARGLTVQTDARLREMNQGELEGYLGAELRAMGTYDAFFAAWARDSVDVVAPGGESLRQTLARASAALAAILQAYDREGETQVLVVSHGLTIQMLIAEAIGLPLENAARIRPQHSSVSTVRYPAADNPRTRYPVLVRLNDRHHLDDTVPVAGGPRGIDAGRGNETMGAELVRDGSLPTADMRGERSDDETGGDAAASAGDARGVSA